MEPSSEVDEIARQVVDSAIEVHRHLGPGLLEDHYKDALQFELRSRDISAEREVPVPVMYKGRPLGRDYALDMLVGGEVVVEATCARILHAVHVAQLLSYLRMTGKQVGFVLNFHERLMKHGITRVAATRFLHAGEDED